MIRVGSGRSAVTISGPLAEGLERELRAALGPVGDVLVATATEIRDAAAAEWPVRTGRSRDSLRVDLRVDPSSLVVEATIGVVDYARYIDSSRVGTERNATRSRKPLDTLIRQPAKEAKAELKRRLPEVLARSLQEAIDRG